MEIQWLPFPQRKNETGTLTFLEGVHQIPFEIKRVYYIHHVKADARRGFHAHKKLQQVLVCVHGSCKILLDDGSSQKTVTLSDPSLGLYIGNAVWREMFDFSEGAVLPVFASEYYDESDYIRNYDEFKKFLQQTERVE